MVRSTCYTLRARGRQQRQAGNTREVTEIERDQRQAVDDRRRGDDQIMGADGLTYGRQLCRDRSMTPGDLLIERQDPHQRDQSVEALLPARLTRLIAGSVNPDEEFG